MTDGWGEVPFEPDDYDPFEDEDRRPCKVCGAWVPNDEITNDGCYMCSPNL